MVKNADATFRLTRQDQIQWNFTASGRLTSIVDLNNNSLSLNYDGVGQLTSLVDLSGHVLSFAYDAGGFLTSVTDPINRTFTFSHAGTVLHLWRVNEPSPSTFFIELGYNGYERVTSAQDQRGNTWTFAYEVTSPFRLTNVTNPQSNSRSYSYPFPETLVADENGNSVTYRFGTSGQVTSISRYPTPGAPLTDSYTYDADWNVTSTTRPSGAVWDFTSDSNGNLLTVEDPITRLDPNITRATFTYNASNRRTSAKDAAGHLHAYGYDAP